MQDILAWFGVVHYDESFKNKRNEEEQEEKREGRKENIEKRRKEGIV